MNRTMKIGAGIGVGAAAVAVASMMAVASPVATSLTADDATPSPTSSAQPNEQGRRSGHAGETPLTGEDATKATAAAEAAVSGGTVLRVETDSDGVYEAHVRKSDGTQVVVKLDKDFTVTGVEEFTGRGGHGGPGAGETPLTGDKATKATAAAEAEVPGGTVLRVETDAQGTYEAHVRKSDGTEVVVAMDSSFTVTGVEEFQGRGGRGGHRDGDGDGAMGDADDTSSATATPSA